MSDTYLILGATGHVGSSVVKALLKSEKNVITVVHRPEKQKEFESLGAKCACVDLNNSENLSSLFKTANRLFLLNPPADHSKDSESEERKTLQSIFSALTNSSIEFIVAESTYGAQPGKQIGDLGTLYEMEQTLLSQKIPFNIIRAAYYMSNWDTALQSAQREGIIHTLYPVFFKLPMVAPVDIGSVASELLISAIPSSNPVHVEGPSLYNSAEVASAFSAALDKQVVAIETPPNDWIPVLKGLGFSENSAKSMAAMTALTIEHCPMADEPIRGGMSLAQYVFQLVHQ